MSLGDADDRRTWWLLALEVAIIAGIFYADAIHRLPFSKTPFFLLLGWVSLRLRQQRWSDAGLKRSPEWVKLLCIGAVVGAGMEALELFVTQPVLTKWLGKGPDLSQLSPLIGNARLLVIALLLAWVLAAFGEELIYRGYLMNRLAELGGGSHHAWITSLILITILFGCAHAPQGVTGILENIVDGGILGLLYLACGRNLLAPIIAHGVQDSVDVLLIFSGHYPGM